MVRCLGEEPEVPEYNLDCECCNAGALHMREPESCAAGNGLGCYHDEYSFQECKPPCNSDEGWPFAHPDIVECHNAVSHDE